MPSHLLAERDRLEHQRSRIEEILSDRVVSTEMEDQLRRRLSYISRRLVELGAAVQLPPPLSEPAVHYPA